MRIGLSLATIGVAVSITVMALGAHYVLGLPWELAVLLGAVTSPTDAAAVFSVLRAAPITKRLSGALEAESGLNDAPTVVLVTLISTEALGEHGILATAGIVVYELVVGVGCGLLAGFGGAWLMRRAALPASGLYPIAVLTLAFLAYGAAAFVHASGFAAVYVAALILGNSELPHRGDLRPLFLNAEGKPPDPKRVQLIGALSPTDFAGTYEPHTEQIWPGAGPIQEYDSTTFANNHGFIDRDRSFENPDKCFRIGSIGSSLAVALQVRIGQKYNIIMESDLAVRLGRCVEVISAGRDNGDVGSNYRNIKNYAAMFKPDIIMLENGNSLMMQMQPDLLRFMLGWSHEYNAIDNFYYNDGKLAFRRNSPEYPLHTAPAKLNAIEGIPLTQVLMVPSAVMPSVGKDAYRYFEDIMKFIMKEFPTIQFVVHTGLDQMTCSKSNSCVSELKLPDGRTVLAGYRVFAQNLLEACRRATATCVDPIIYEGLNTKKTPLSWIYDGHYNPRGHQWMAEQLISLLEHRLGLSNPK